MGLMYTLYNGLKNMKGKTIVTPWSYAENNEVDPQSFWGSFKNILEDWRMFPL